MEYTLCKIGDEELYLPLSDTIKKTMLKVKTVKDYTSNCELTIDPQLIYAFEDELYKVYRDNVFHKQFIECKTNKKMLYLLFREGKTIRYLADILNCSKEEILNTLQDFFSKISQKLK